MSTHVRIQIIDDLWVVGFTTDAIDFEPAADGFTNLREAIDYADQLEGRPTSRSGEDAAAAIEGAAAPGPSSPVRGAGASPGGSRPGGRRSSPRAAAPGALSAP